MTDALAFGRLLRASTLGFVVGCRVTELDTPSFGDLVRVPQPANLQIYGLIYDIHIDDDGLVRQLVTTPQVEETIIADNRYNRNVPIEMSVLAVGYELNGEIRHLLPPRPPLSLDSIYVCSSDEICRFTNSGRFGYFRHIIRASDLPVGELLAAHLVQTHASQQETGDPDWSNKATQKLITLLRDDYQTLMAVLSALGDTNLI